MAGTTMTKPMVFEIQQTIKAVAEGQPYTKPNEFHAGRQVCLATDVETYTHEATMIIERLTEALQDNLRAFKGMRLRHDSSSRECGAEIEEIELLLANLKNRLEA